MNNAWIIAQRQLHRDRVDRRLRKSGKHSGVAFLAKGHPVMLPKSHETRLLKLERRGKIKARALRQLETKQREEAKKALVQA